MNIGKAKICHAAIAALVGVIGSQTRAEEAAPQIDPDTGAPVLTLFQLPEVTVEPFWSKRLTGYLTTRQGTKLRYSVLLPKATGPVPVIVSVNGYDAGSIGGSSYLKHQTAMSPELDRRLIEAGYAVMGVNPAGTGCSQGQFALFQKELGENGADAVKFAGTQRWSNGNVGMVNWSYGGASQAATAVEQPAHLRAIVPGAVLLDLRPDILAPGGVPQQGFQTPWRTFLRMYWNLAADSAKDEGDSECVAQVARNDKNEHAASVTTLQYGHPWRDTMMDRHNYAFRHVERIKVPVLSLEQFQDEATGPRGGHYRDRLNQDLVWLIQTNGPHDLYFSTVYQKTVVRFLDRFVKGERNGFEAETPRTTVWMETGSKSEDFIGQLTEAAPRWTVQRPQLIKPSDLKTLEFHLTEGARLTDKAGSGNADGFDYPGAGVGVNKVYDGGVPGWRALPDDWKQSSVAYTSLPFASDTMIYGSGSADLWFTSTNGDADVQVTVTEVRPDGQEMYVQRGWLRLSNRAIDKSRSTPLRPVLMDTAASVQPLYPAAPVLGRIEINKMGHYMRKGSRLRLWVDTPSDTGEWSFDVFGLKQRLHVLHNAKYDSVVRFGVLPDVKGPEEYAACGSVMMQPCRPDPLAAK